MATVLDHQLTFNPPDLDGLIRTVTKLKLSFSAREVAEDLDYGVHVQLIRRKPFTEYVSVPKGNGGMHLLSIPADPNMLISGNSVKIKPATTQTVEVEVFYVAATVSRGTPVQSVAHVAPEISDTVNFSGPKPAP